MKPAKILFTCILFSAFFCRISWADTAYIRDEKNNIWQVEVAATPAQRNHGLMHRFWMAPWQGMLFLFPHSQYSEFWMRNTLIPLDIRFYQSDSRLIAYYHHLPPCYALPCPTYSSLGEAVYVLETPSNSWIGKDIRIIFLPQNTYAY